jgi:carbon monoxide dehydrogenase subunit G
MRLDHQFTVPVPVEQAWQVLLDLPRVVPCMPGATLTGTDGDAFTGTVKVKLGPITLTYQGTGRFAERDEATRRIVVEASGKDVRAAGTAKATVTAVMVGKDDTTTVDVTTDLTVTGRPAQFGRGMIADVSAKLLGQFADCLAETVAAEPPGQAGADGTGAGQAGTEPVNAAQTSTADAGPGRGGTEPVSTGPTGTAGADSGPTGTGGADAGPTGTTDAGAGQAGGGDPGTGPGGAQGVRAAQPVEPPRVDPLVDRPITAPVDPPATVGSVPTGALANEPATVSTPAPATTTTTASTTEAEPIDLLKITGSTAAARRLALRGVLLGVLAWVAVRWLRRARR